MAEGILAGVAFVDILPRFGKFAAGMDKGLAGVQAKAGAVGKKLSTHLTLPILAIGAESIKMSVDFSSSMEKINGLVGVTGKQLEDMRKGILAMAPAVGQGPKELADALFFITSAGLRGKAALDVLRQSAKGATSGLGETKTVADAVTSAMNAYGKGNLSASRAVDILSNTVKSGKVEASAIAPVLGSLLPLSQRLGVGFDQVGASLASMTRIGESAPRAATALRGLYTSLLNVTPKVTAELKKHGLSQQALLNTLKDPKQGLPVVLQQLDKAFGGNVLAMRKAFPNIRGMSGLMELTGKNTKTTLGIFKDMRNSTGQNEKAFKAIQEGPGFKFHKLLLTLQVDMIKLGDILTPFALRLVAFIERLHKRFNQLSPAQKEFIGKLVLMAATIGPLLLIVSKFIGLARFMGRQVLGIARGMRDLAKGIIYVVKAFIRVIPQMWGWLKAGAKVLWNIITTTARLVVQGAVWLAQKAAMVASAAATYAMAAAQWALNVAMEANPITLIIIALVALGVALYILWRKSGTFREIVTGAFNAVKHAAMAVWGFIKSHWKLLLAILTGPFGLMVYFVSQHLGTIRDKLGNLIDFIKKLPGRVASAAKGLFDGIKDAFRSAVNWIIDKWNGLSFKLPEVDSHIPGVGKVGGWALNTPDIPRLRKGGLIDGAAVVGEGGPEVYMPRIPGRIFTNGALAAALAGGGGRSALTITNWRDGTGYIESIADGSVNRAARLTRQRDRMHR